jgi:hypothetical protein
MAPNSSLSWRAFPPAFPSLWRWFTTISPGVVWVTAEALE